MSFISSNSYINKKRQSNARKTAAVVAHHRQLAFQIHWNSSAQSSSSACFSTLTMMLQERDFNMNMTLKRRKERSIRKETQSMSFIKQRKITQQMKFARQNLEDRSDICKLQNRWEDIRQRHQRYCKKATRLNRSSLSFLLVTSKKLRLTLIQSLISRSWLWSVYRLQYVKSIEWLFLQRFDQFTHLVYLLHWQIKSFWKWDALMLEW